MKRYGLVILALACLSMSSCSLLPEEETFSTAPMVRVYEREAFQLAYAERGDMVLTEKVSCTYMPVQTEVLRYPVGGVYYDETFVEVGDSVVAGQLLSQLQLSGVQDNIENCKRQIEKLNIRLAAVEENRALAIEKQRILMKESTAAALNEQLESIHEQYDAQKQSLTDELHLTEVQLSEYELQLAQRQLFAGIDGTVTYIRSVQNGDRSVEGDRFITIADASMSLFRADTDLWELFEPGQEYLITVSKKEYEAIVVTEEELGIPATEKVPGEKEYVYFKLKQPTFDLEDGDRGTLVVVLDSREDVLKVPESAVSTANGESIVYYQDEAGMKAYKPVVTGLRAEKMVEIVSGLTEGESVIVEK